MSSRAGVAQGGLTVVGRESIRREATITPGVSRKLAMTHLLARHRWFWLSVGMVGWTLAVAVPCQAGPLWDALFGRRNNYYYPVGTQYAPVAGYYPVTAYYPVTTYYPVAPVATAPLTVNYAPWTPAPSTATTAYYVPAYPSTVGGVTAAAGTTVIGATPPIGTGLDAAGGDASRVTNFYAPDHATLPTTMGGTVLSPGMPFGSSAVQSPTTVYSANMALAAAAPCATCPTAPRAVGYFPQPSYRTVWHRVPVTSYRPTTAFDAAGQPITALSPCTTYTWQARRVPAASGGGFLSRLFGRRQNQAPILLPVTAGGVAQPATVCAPQNAVISPSLPASRYPGAPGTSFPGGSTIRDPADVPPSLDPSTYPPPPGTPTVREGSVDSRRPALGDTAVSTARSTQEASSAPAAASPGPDRDALFNLNPVPAPSAERDAQKPFNPPRLLNPRDKSAAVNGPPAGAFVLVSWPESPAASAAVVPASASQPVATPPAAPARRTDSGWTTKK